MEKIAEPIRAYLVADEQVQERRVRLLRNGANKAVRIPKEFELPGNDAVMRRDGDRLIIETVKPIYKKGSPAALLAAQDAMAKIGPIDEEFPGAAVRRAI